MRDIKILREKKKVFGGGGSQPFFDQNTDPGPDVCWENSSTQQVARRCDALVAEYLIICKINPKVLSSLLIHHLVNISELLSVNSGVKCVL
jgi:hypothetical protein